jgi:hypothetical protein
MATEAGGAANGVAPHSKTDVNLAFDTKNKEWVEPQAAAMTLRRLTDTISDGKGALRSCPRPS